MKKKLSNFFVCLILMLCVFTFSGCSLFDLTNTAAPEEIDLTEFEEENESTDYAYINDMQGIKACYKPSSNEFGNIYQDFAENVLNSLINTYGAPNSGTNSQVVKFLNTILYQMNLTEGVYTKYTNTSWKWSVTFTNTDYDIFNSNESVSENDLIDFYINNHKINNIRDSYAVLFRDRYLIPLQIVTYEIVLGLEPTIFNSGDFSNSEMLNSRLTSIKGRFSNEATYIGLSDSDCEKLGNYILDNVIGTNLITSYNTSGIAKNYVENVETIIENHRMNNSLNNPYPNAKFKDYSRDYMFMSGLSNPLKHIPCVEYQSLLFMPSRTDKLLAIWLCLESPTDMDIRVGMRAYDSQTKTLTDTLIDTYSVKAGTFDIGTGIIMIDIGDNYQIDNFDNSVDNGLISTTASTTKEVNRTVTSGQTNSTADYYKCKPSLNGFGTISVVNEQFYIDNNLGNYFELYFDVVKDNTQNQNYNFKVGFMGIFFTVE